MQLWKPNQTIHNGRFIIQKVLGNNCFKVTYKVIEKHTSKLFVIETLNPIQYNQVDFQEKQVKFANKAVKLAKCIHPNIVQVYEIIEQDGIWGIVMEHIEGDNLKAYVDKQGKLSETESLGYIEQIGQALQNVHENGFLHQNIKPNNIIIRRNSKEAILSNFSLSPEFSVERVEIISNVITESYAPIEQYEKGDNLAPCIDVYALAATLYTLLTKEVPLSTKSRKEGVPLIPPKQLNPDICDNVNEAILKGMVLEAEDRVQTVQKWLELLSNNHNCSTPQKEQELSSAQINYIYLRELLSAGKWEKADRETARVMLVLAGRERQDWLDSNYIDNLSSKDLRTIDKLWLEHSNGRFGFSVQKRIYKILEKNIEEEQKIWESFGDTVGWRINKQWMNYREITKEWIYYKELIDLTLKAQPGELPRLCYMRGNWEGWGFCLVSKLLNLELYG